jgi:hypothetical protein
VITIQLGKVILTQVFNGFQKQERISFYIQVRMGYDMAATDWTTRVRSTVSGMPTHVEELTQPADHIVSPAPEIVQKLWLMERFYCRKNY